MENPLCTQGINELDQFNRTQLKPKSIGPINLVHHATLIWSLYELYPFLVNTEMLAQQTLTVFVFARAFAQVKHIKLYKIWTPVNESRVFTTFMIEHKIRSNSVTNRWLSENRADDCLETGDFSTLEIWIKKCQNSSRRPSKPYAVTT